MFNVGIRRLTARSFRLFHPNVRSGSHSRRPFPDSQLWESRSYKYGRRSSPIRTISVSALTAGSGVYVQADGGEEDTIVHEKELTVEKHGDNVDTECKADSKRTKVVAILEYMLYEMIDSRTRAFLYGLLGANVAVYSAFTLGMFLASPPKPSLTLLRFLSRNFILSLGWLSRGRWHVMLTCMFTHLSWPHLIRNMWGIFFGVFLCSRFLDVRQIAGLYFGGGLVGASVTMALNKILRKPRYLRPVTGASDGIYALQYYWVCVEDWEFVKSLPVPVEAILKALFVYVFVTEGIGLRKFITYGYEGTGRNAVVGSHAAHLGGAVTGLVAYGAPRVLNNFQRNVSGNEDNKRNEHEDRTEKTREATLVKDA